MLRTIRLVAVALLIGGCSGDGGCGGCFVTEPLPAGGIPTDQTIEGGMQLRVNPNGLKTLTSLVPAVLQDTLANNDTCIGSDGFGVGVGRIDYCHLDDGGCVKGCGVTMDVDSVDIGISAQDLLRVDLQFDISVDVPVRFDPILGGNSSCTIVASADNLRIALDIATGIDPATGEFTLDLRQIPDLDINVNLAPNCGTVINAITNLAEGILDGISAILGVGFIRDLLTPVLEQIVQDILPDPLGFEGLIKLGTLIGEATANSSASLEARVVPGAYVHLERGGVSLGGISGINSDSDPGTRTDDLDSEPAACVPPFASPDFGVAPANLAVNSRGNFQLPPADRFRGVPDTANDVLIGLSETMLNQMGHHLIRSGAFCIRIGTESIPQLNLAAIGLFVPSLLELGSAEGNDPLLMVARPTQPVEFTIGEGTEVSPSLAIELSEFNLDVYAFLFERYVRVFTVTLDIGAGINVEFTTDADGRSAVLPVLTALNSSTIDVQISNDELLREDPATLALVFPTILDLVIPQIVGGIDAITIPDIAGFQIRNLSVEHVVTSADDFLAIGGDLGVGATMMAFAERFPSFAEVATTLRSSPAIPTSANARLIEVVTPNSEEIRASVMGNRSNVVVPSVSRQPAVHLELDSHDELGRELEWTWNLDGGMWRPFIKGGAVVLRDGAFHIQGRYQLQVRARPVDDYRAWDPRTISMEVVIDSVGPRISADESRVHDGILSISAFDDVYQHDIQTALGAVGAQQPSTEWVDDSFSAERAEDIAIDGELRVFVRDPKNNVSSATVRISSGAESRGSVGCSASRGTSGSGGLLLVFVVVGLCSVRRRRVSLVVAGLMSVVVAVSGCHCGSDPMASTAACLTDEECQGACDDGQLVECIEEACQCSNEVFLGRIGEFSAMDVDAKGRVWVSGYSTLYGDLVVASTTALGRISDDAWQFVDGIPDGPAIRPAHGIRGGVNASGDDVGRHTDIAVAEDGTVMVSYFDQTRGTLKIAVGDGTEWHNHVVDSGSKGGEDSGAGEITGRYSAISLDADGTPSIAYFASNGLATEVRLAQARSAFPRSRGDWDVLVVDSALDERGEVQENDALSIPYGTGLFVQLVRDANHQLMVVYYNRIRGDLMLARVSEGVVAVQALATDGDVGRHPSVTVDREGVLHASYMDANNQHLMYINDVDRAPMLVDDGYRIVGATRDGLPIPEFHFVGGDSNIVVTRDGISIVYQDASTHELLIASASLPVVDSDRGWERSVVAGDGASSVGAYGFYADAKFQNDRISMSTFALDRRDSDSWIEIFQWPTVTVD